MIKVILATIFSFLTFFSSTCQDSKETKEFNRVELDPYINYVASHNLKSYPIESSKVTNKPLTTNVKGGFKLNYWTKQRLGVSIGYSIQSLFQKHKIDEVFPANSTWSEPLILDGTFNVSYGMIQSIDFGLWYKLKSLNMTLGITANKFLGYENSTGYQEIIDDVNYTFFNSQFIIDRNEKLLGYFIGIQIGRFPINKSRFPFAVDVQLHLSQSNIGRGSQHLWDLSRVKSETNKYGLNYLNIGLTYRIPIIKRLKIS